MDKILITGSSGYLGHALVTTFSELGHNVTAVDLNEPDERRHGVCYVTGDIANRDFVLSLFDSTFTIVIHCAAYVPLTKKTDDFDHVNYIGTRLIIETSLSHQVKFIVHMSSSAIWGVPPRNPVQSADPLCPIEPYGESKAKADSFCIDKIAEGCPIAVIRPRTIVGPERLGIFQILFDFIRDDAPVFLIGDGKNKIQLAHSDDIITATRMAIDRGASGLFNVGVGKFETIENDLAELIRYAGSKSRIFHLPERGAKVALYILDRLRLSPLAPWHYLTYSKDFYFDPDELKRQISYDSPHTNLSTLKEAYDWYISSFNEGREGSSIHRSKVPTRALALLKYLRWVIR